MIRFWIRSFPVPFPALRVRSVITHYKPVLREPVPASGHPSRVLSYRKSFRPDLNREPAHYKCAALPLSYESVLGKAGIEPARQQAHPSSPRERDLLFYFRLSGNCRILSSHILTAAGLEPAACGASEPHALAN